MSDTAATGEDGYVQKYDASKDPDAVRWQLQTESIASYYWSKLESGDNKLSEKLENLHYDKELAHVFEDILTNGPQAASRYTSSEKICIKVSKKMGGIPKDVKKIMKSMEQWPVTIHEACKMGSLNAVEDYVESAAVTERKGGIDEKDAKGISPLGYAIGAGRLEIVKLLLGAKADPEALDAQGSNCLHYAAGYGRPEILSYLLKTVKVDANQRNSAGKTPLDLAKKNRQDSTQKLLKK